MIGLLEQLFERFSKPCPSGIIHCKEYAALDTVTQTGSQHLGGRGRRIMSLYILGEPGTHREFQAGQKYTGSLKSGAESERMAYQ